VFTGMYFETVRLGLKNIRLHKLRSFLTALGIILGGSGVICMRIVDEGASASLFGDREPGRRCLAWTTTRGGCRIQAKDRFPWRPAREIQSHPAQER
jgi:hypothetical protein